MTLDSRTPVVVGVGQVTIHPDPDIDPADRPEPVELMARGLAGGRRGCQRRRSREDPLRPGTP